MNPCRRLDPHPSPTLTHHFLLSPPSPSSHASSSDSLQSPLLFRSPCSMRPAMCQHHALGVSQNALRRCQKKIKNNSMQNLPRNREQSSGGKVRKYGESCLRMGRTLAQGRGRHAPHDYPSPCSCPVPDESPLVGKTTQKRRDWAVSGAGAKFRVQWVKKLQPGVMENFKESCLSPFYYPLWIPIEHKGNPSHNSAAGQMSGSASSATPRSSSRTLSGEAGHNP